MHLTCHAAFIHLLMTNRLSMNIESLIDPMILIRLGQKVTQLKVNQSKGIQVWIDRDLDLMSLLLLSDTFPEAPS